MVDNHLQNKIRDAPSNEGEDIFNQTIASFAAKQKRVKQYQGTRHIIVRVPGSRMTFLAAQTRHFRQPKHPRQVHFGRGICTSRGSLYEHTYVQRTCGTAPSATLDSGLGHAEARGQDRRMKKVLRSVVPPYLLCRQAHPPRSTSRRVVR